MNAARRSVLLRQRGHRIPRGNATQRSAEPSAQRGRCAFKWLRGCLCDLGLVNECLVSGCPADRRQVRHGYRRYSEPRAPLRFKVYTFAT